MKKFTAVTMALVLTSCILIGCGESDADTPDVENQSPNVDVADEDAVYTYDWGEYDALIDEIKTTTDFARREELMHKAEDILMETGVILPVYYYNDTYMQKDYVSNIYSSPFGFKFFMFSRTQGDTLRLSISGEPDGLDPALCSDVEGASFAVNSFAGLYTYGAEGGVIPDLAADEQVSEDGLTYTVTLLPDLKWSNGSELNADDFVYAWNRAADENTAAKYAYMFDIIDRNDDGTLKVEASDDAQVLTIRLKAPCAYFNELLAVPAYFPVKKSEVERASDWETNPGAWAQKVGFISNGAYTLAEWTHDESMTYIKNPYYHRADEVETTTLQFELSADDMAVYASYNAGDLDFIDSVPSDDIPDLLTNSEFNIADRPGIFYVSFNVNSPLFDGKTAAQAGAMRRAFALLVDRDYICTYVTRTGQKPANSYIPFGMADGNGGVFKTNDAGYTFPDGESVGYFDTHWSAAGVEEAIALLEFAGFKFENGMLSAETPISLEYLVSDDPAYIAVAEALQQDFSEIGIDMTIKIAYGNEFMNERKSDNYDMTCNSLFADVNDPISMLEIN